MSARAVDVVRASGDRAAAGERVHYVEVTRALLRTTDAEAALAWWPSEEQISRTRRHAARGEQLVDPVVVWVSCSRGFIWGTDPARFAFDLENVTLPRSDDFPAPPGDEGGDGPRKSEPLPLSRQLGGALDEMIWATIGGRSIWICDAVRPRDGLGPQVATFREVLRLTLPFPEMARSFGATEMEGLRGPSESHLAVRDDLTGLDRRVVVAAGPGTIADGRWSGVARVGYEPGQTYVVLVRRFPTTENWPLPSDQWEIEHLLSRSTTAGAYRIEDLRQTIHSLNTSTQETSE